MVGRFYHEDNLSRISRKPFKLLEGDRSTSTEICLMQIGSTNIASQGIASYGRVDPRDDEEEGHGPQRAGHAGKEASRVTLSPEARHALESETPAPAEKRLRPGELTPEQEKDVEELKARDAEVRTHEQAHVAAAGGLASGGIHYEYQRGPDNQQYAIGGHVNIDTAPVPGDPEKTIRKAETIRRSALAPAEPSTADKRIAAKASQMASAARAEMAVEAQEEQAKAKEEPKAERGEEAQGLGPRPSVPTSHALASYAMAA